MTLGSHDIFFNQRVFQNFAYAENLIEHHRTRTARPEGNGGQVEIGRQNQTKIGLIAGRRVVVLKINCKTKILTDKVFRRGVFDDNRILSEAEICVK